MLEELPPGQTEVSLGTRLEAGNGLLEFLKGNPRKDESWKPRQTSSSLKIQGLELLHTVQLFTTLSGAERGGSYESCLDVVGPWEKLTCNQTLLPQFFVCFLFSPLPLKYPPDSYPSLVPKLPDPSDQLSMSQETKSARLTKSNHRP